MTQQEFTERTRLDVTAQEYTEIENIYMAAGDMDKDEFCKEYARCGKSYLVNVLASSAIERERQTMQLQKERDALVDFLLERAHAFSDIQLLNKAILMVGHAEVIKRKIAHNYSLWDIDKEYIKENIG